MALLTFSWDFPYQGRATLIFNKHTWAVYQAKAAERNMDDAELISVAVAELLGPIAQYRLRD